MLGHVALALARLSRLTLNKLSAQAAGDDQDPVARHLRMIDEFESSKVSKDEECCVKKRATVVHQE